MRQPLADRSQRIRRGGGYDNVRLAVGMAVSRSRSAVGFSLCRSRYPWLDFDDYAVLYDPAKDARLEIQEPVLGLRDPHGALDH